MLHIRHASVTHCQPSPMCNTPAANESSPTRLWKKILPIPENSGMGSRKNPSVIKGTCRAMANFRCGLPCECLSPGRSAHPCRQGGSLHTCPCWCCLAHLRWTSAWRSWWSGQWVPALGWWDRSGVSTCPHDSTNFFSFSLFHFWHLGLEYLRVE